MFVYGGTVARQRCPAVDGHEEGGWSGQCAVYPQWSARPDDACGAYNSMYGGDLSVQCYGGGVPVEYYTPPAAYARPPQYLRNDPPCRQRPDWDYDTNCFNVDGRPCQYTSVVDLEDFMNNEKRKEKSRVAARCRRTKEMQIFAELTAALPAKKEEVEQLDKASVMRLAISYLRVRDVVSILPEDQEQPQLKSPKGLEEIQSELSYMNALDGFVLVLSQQGDIVYCSENIAEHLGVSQMEIMGQSVFEFSHPCDHDEVREALRSNSGRQELLLRMKCTLTSKGRNVHLKSASYKVIHVVGHMLTPKSKANKATEQNNNHETDDEKKEETKKDPKIGSLVAVGRPIPHPANIQIPLDSKTFLSKHSLDMKFTYTDEGLMNTLGFEPDELVGRSAYDYHHAADSAALIHQFKSLFSKGQCETGQYRFLAKSGGYAWVQTQATVITDKQQKPDSVVCVNYVISGIECRDEVFAAQQVRHADLKQPTVGLRACSPPATQLPPICDSADPPNGAVVAHVPPEEERPIPVTELIFAPREKEMNKGFLMFSQDEGITMLKDEPDDLTHLAPTAGDACIPLENCPFDMFDEFILSDNYCSLLGDDLATGSPVDSLIADSLLSSPEPQETESSCEQSSLLTELSLDAFDGARSDNDVDDGSSPFIPATDELPLLEPAVMWGALPDNVSLARPQPSEAATTAPALQRLLTAPPTGPPPQDLITNIYSDQGLLPSGVPAWDTGVKRVMKQEEDHLAKRVKRSPSPAPKAQGAASSSSVLMNLLDIQRQQQLQSRVNRGVHLVLDPHTRATNKTNKNDIPIPVLDMMRAMPDKQMTRANRSIDNVPNIRSNLTNAMSPLSVNVGSPMYSLPPSPTYSPTLLSPARKERGLSPYRTQAAMYSPGSGLVSPTGVMLGYDPYLSNKFQTSPGFAVQPSAMMDGSANMTPTDFWTDSELMQGSNDVLIAFDDV